MGKTDATLLVGKQWWKHWGFVQSMFLNRSGHTGATSHHAMPRVRTTTGVDVLRAQATNLRVALSQTLLCFRKCSSHQRVGKYPTMPALEAIKPVSIWGKSGEWASVTWPWRAPDTKLARRPGRHSETLPVFQVSLVGNPRTKRTNFTQKSHNAKNMQN